MNKCEIFSHYSKVIDNLIDATATNFFAAYFSAPWSLDSNLYGDSEDALPSNISICDGATRACIIDDSYDYVVKFDIEEDRYGSVCEREEEIYSAAKANSLGCYFNELTYIGTYTRTIYFYDTEEIQYHCNYSIYDINRFDEEIKKHEDEMTIRPITISLPLYACRRAIEYDCGPFDNTLVAQAQKVVSPLRSRNICVATAFIKNYGVEEYELVSEFAIAYEINDLHIGNIGEVDGRFVFTDFGGYWSEDDNDDEEEWN